MLNIAVAKPGLQRPSVVSRIRQRVAARKKGALSIARRRRPSWQAEWAIRHGERTKVAIAEPSYATLACVGYWRHLCCKLAV